MRLKKSSAQLVQAPSGEYASFRSGFSPVLPIGLDGVALEEMRSPTGRLRHYLHFVNRKRELKRCSIKKQDRLENAKSIDRKRSQFYCHGRKLIFGLRD